MGSEDNPEICLLDRVRDVTAMICSLPAVPTQDWCDRAAVCLCGVDDRCAALVVVGTIDPAGQMVSREGAGAAAAPAYGVGTDDGPCAGAIGSMRAPWARLPSLGWALKDRARREVCGPMDHLSPGWRGGAIARIWGRALRGNLLGAGYILEPRAGRMLAAYVAVHGKECGAGAVLKTALPLLGVRTLAALGPTGGDARNWVTLREQEILDQLATGRSVRQIAEALGRSPHTVHDHVKTLHRKLRATTRGQLIARALGHGGPGTGIDCDLGGHA